jgi:hypothetical protein
MLNLHPSCFANLSVVRWTAPASGWFSVVGLFQGIDTRNTTTDVHIVHNSATTLLGADINGFSDQATFNFVRYFTSGDTLDFGVGLGSDGYFNADSTGLAVTIKAERGYSICTLYDSTKAVQSGSTLPIKLQLCDNNGNNFSSSAIVLHATGITQTSTSISGAVQASGNANPDSDFRFDSTLGSTRGYIFNLSTKGLGTGTYQLNFTVLGESFVYGALFQVK